MPKAAKVAVIDDDESLRKAVARLLIAAGLEVLAFASAGEFLNHPSRDATACALVDLRMPGMSGLELQEKLRDAVPYLSVVFVTGHGDVPASVHAMKAGAVDFLEKPTNEEVLLAAVNRAVERSGALRAELAQLGEFTRRHKTLTPRERQVFELITAGLLNKQVGFELGAAEKTVKVHRARVMEKMGANSLAELVVMAHRLGIRSA